MRTETNLAARAFICDPASIDRTEGRQVDFNLLGAAFDDSAFIVKLAAAALADATSLTVDALEYDVPVGTNLHFGQSKEFARVTAHAVAGATSLAVEALPSALEDDDEAYVGRGGKKRVAAGTVMVIVAATGKMVPRSARPGAETAVGIIETDADEDSKSDSKSGYGLIVGGVVYENLLPDATGSPKVLPTDYKTEMQTAGVGTGFAFRQYADDTAA
jgi:hypothetical protein